MEAAVLVDCFKSSIQNLGLRYTNFIGDGDSKSYLEIVANDSYSGVTVQKLGCVEHFQKRVGARLQKLKSENKGKLSAGKPLTGKGRLTEKAINKLQNYFGIAIRQHTGTTVFELKKAIGAVLYHCTDFIFLKLSFFGLLWEQKCQKIPKMKTTNASVTRRISKAVQQAYNHNFRYTSVK